MDLHNAAMKQDCPYHISNTSEFSEFLFENDADCYSLAASNCVFLTLCYWDCALDTAEISGITERLGLEGNV